MFTETDLDFYIKVQHKLPSTAADYLTACYYGEASRPVGVNAKENVISWVPSPKLNGWSFSTESRGAERALNTLAQVDDNFLWHGDQPIPIDIVRTDKNGRRRRGSYTPDAISLTKKGPLVYEAKTLSDVEKLLAENPSDWQRMENGAVVYKPAKEAYEQLGLEHVVYIYTPEDRYYISNLNHILWVRECEDITTIGSDSIRDVMDKFFALSLSELKQELKLNSITPLVRAIDDGSIVADLKGQLIAEPDSILVSSTHALLEHGKEIRDSQRIYWRNLVEPQSVAIIPNRRDAEEALKRLAAIDEGPSNRNTRRWKARIRAGEKEGLSPFQSLISRYDLCGKKSSNLNTKVKTFLDKYLLEVHIRKQGISVYRGHKDYQVLAKKEHPEFEPVSRKTFTLHLAKIPPEVIGYARGGKRLGNAMAEPTDPQERHLKAQAAWERAAIDHYCVDLFLVVYTKTEKIIVERPWLTLMIDLHTGKVLAFSISFLKPSRRSVAKVLRACVRNHGKLPREIIVDRGAEFKSVYLASLLAHYSVILSMRPASHPRYGSEVEGFFGEFKKQWLCQREGNLADYKEARSVDGNKAPKKAAILSPGDFHRELTAFCNWRANKCRGTGSYSSEALFEQSFNNFPYVAKGIDYNSEFIVVTCVETKQYTLDMQRGINIEGTWYSSPTMQLLLGKPKKNEVRLDPENPNLIFVKVRTQWEPFYSSEINTYSAKSGEYQIAEGMIKHEAAGLKRKIREEDDLVLARLVHEMDQYRTEHGTTPILEIELGESTQEQAHIFSKLKTANVRPVNIQSWRA